MARRETGEEPSPSGTLSKPWSEAAQEQSASTYWHSKPEIYVPPTSSPPRGYLAWPSFLKDENSFMIRRFAIVHYRVLLNQQELLHDLELQVQELDMEIHHDQWWKSPPRPAIERQSLYETIRKRLRKYGK